MAALGSVEWFRAVGTVDNDNVKRATSWADALELAAETGWEDVQLETMNELQGVIRALAPDLDWSAFVRDIRPRVLALVETKTAEAQRDHGCPRNLTASVSWDLLGYAIEAAFANELAQHRAALAGTELESPKVPGPDFASPGFYSTLGRWYERGHWPCGWVGSCSSGKLVVF